MAEVPVGELNKRIKIIKKTAESDADGYETEPSEKVVRSCWAKFTRNSGTELVKANADFGQVKARFLVRWTSTRISRKMIVRYAGDDYKIEYVNPYQDDRRYTEIWATLLTLEG